MLIPKNMEELSLRHFFSYKTLCKRQRMHKIVIVLIRLRETNTIRYTTLQIRQKHWGNDAISILCTELSNVVNNVTLKINAAVVS